MRRQKYKKVEFRWRCAFICFILLDATIHGIATACSIVAAAIEDSTVKLALTVAAGVISCIGIVLAVVIPIASKRERINKNKKNDTIGEQTKLSKTEDQQPCLQGHSNANAPNTRDRKYIFPAASVSMEHPQALRYAPPEVKIPY